MSENHGEPNQRLHKLLLLIGFASLIYGCYCAIVFQPRLARMNAIKGGPESHFATLSPEKQASEAGKKGAALIQAMNGITDFARVYAITEIVLAFLMSIAVFTWAGRLRRGRTTPG